MNKKIAIKNLTEISEILKENKVRNFLVYGTALGAYRGGSIIEHDNDTDLGIMAEDWNFDLLKQFTDKGFSIDFIFGMFRFGCEIALMKDGVKTDLMFFYKNEAEGYYWNCLWQNGCRNGEKDKIKHSYPKVMFDNFWNVSLNGRIFNIPAETEDYLILVYGEDWKTPVKNFNWKTDHKCISNE